MEESRQILISIIVAIYKVEKYLNRCIDSIISQPGDDFEIILVDDASPDCCGKICDDYAKLDGRIKVIHHEKNEGVSAARNTGIENAAGKWIGFVDGDDTLTSDALAIMREYSDKEADMILFGNNRVDSYGKIYEFEASFREGYINTSDALYVYKLSLLKHRNNEIYSNHNCPTSCSKMWDRTFLNQYNLRFCTDLRYGEDDVFNLLCLHYLSGIYVAKKVIYNYIQNDESSMMRYSPDMAKMYDSTLNAIMCIIIKNNETEDKNIMGAFYRQCISRIHFCLMRGISHKDCHYNKQDRIKWLEELCSHEWVQHAIAYCEDTGDVDPQKEKIMKAIISRDYRVLDSLCCKIRLKERIKSNKICCRFILIVKRIIKPKNDR